MVTPALPGGSIDLWASTLRTPGVSGRRVDRRADSRAGALRARGPVRLGVGRVPARSPRLARGDRRVRRGFFMYCEDVDLCRRLWNAGQPRRLYTDRRLHVTLAEHRLPLEAVAESRRSRIRYARKHFGPVQAARTSRRRAERIRPMCWPGAGFTGALDMLAPLRRPFGPAPDLTIRLGRPRQVWPFRRRRPACCCV